MTVLRIAQIAPLIESVPPRLYGGTERVVSYLTDALVALGQDVTLFASGESETRARLVACADRALRLDPAKRDPLPYYMVMIDRVRARAGEFDVLHFHIELLHYPVFRPMAECTLTTLHGRQDFPDLQPCYRAFPEMPLVSISAAQRRGLPGANFLATVHHGLPPGLHRPTLVPRGGYLAFLGRIAPEKGIERAVEIARTSGIPLRIAAKIDRVDQAYFEAVAPLFAEPGIEYIGEIGESEKTRFLGDALALLFPIDWPEPFGLVMIEAMACGTPVLAFANGSVPEVVDDGVTGVIVRSMEETPRALQRVLGLDRRKVRQRFEERFSAGRMAADYAALYEQLLSRRRREPAAGQRYPVPAGVLPMAAAQRGATGRPKLRALAALPPEDVT